MSKTPLNGSVHHVKKTSGLSVVENNSIDEITQIFLDLGISPKDFLLFDKLIFVEGKSDELAFKEWIKILNFNLDDIDLGFICLGGVKNFTHFATSATLEFLQNRGIQLWYIIDRDERNNADIESLSTRLKDFENAKIKILNKRELENYFLIPRVILEFIKEKQRSFNLDLSKIPKLDLETITLELNFQVMELRTLTRDKNIFYELSKPGYLDDKKIFPKSTEESIQERLNPEFDRLISFFKEQKERIETVYEEVDKKLNDRWKSEKFSIVPGSKVLMEIAKVYGVKYNKAKDAGLIASFLTEDEIDSEIRELINEILED